MGFIRAAVGIKGWVKVSAHTEYADSLLDFPLWRLQKNTHHRNLSLETGKLTPSGLQVKFAEINDRTAAEALQGYTIFIERTAFAEPEADEYYWIDLIGLRVVNGAGIELGTVSDLMQTGAHDVLVVDGAFGQKLIPFVSQFVLEVSLPERSIAMDWEPDY